MIKEHLDSIIVALVVLSVAMYDVVFDLVFSILHLIFEVIHIMFEWVELGIEHTVEHLFHTSRHGSQVITFYILLLIASLLIYWLWRRVLPRLYKQFIQFVQQAWERRKSECKDYWRSLTLINKVRLLSTATGIVYLTSFIVM
ncbi:MAG: hypothetical protein ACU84H_09430 [Gammaproteobacteria bacterium]